MKHSSLYLVFLVIALASAHLSAQEQQNLTTIFPTATFSEGKQRGFLQPEKIQALFHGSLSTRYLPDGSPRLQPLTNSSLAFMNIGFGTMVFFDNVFLGLHTGIVQEWNIPTSSQSDTRLYEASYLVDASLGYTIWRQEQLQLTPSATFGATRYLFDANLAEYSSRYIGAEMNLTYILPIIPLRYKVPHQLTPHTMDKEFVGSIDGMISLRIGYAQHFSAGFASTTFSEVYARVSIGLGLTRFEQP